MKFEGTNSVLETKISRRAVIASLLASRMFADSRPSGALDIFNVNVKHAKLHSSDGKNDQGQIGYVVTGPQDCGDGKYGTAEWIQEITFVQNADDRRAALAWLKKTGKHKIKDGPNTTGCGHISKNVPVYMLAKDPGTGQWSDSSDARYNGKATFYCLVATGKPGHPKFKADQIWISGQDWDPTLNHLADACKRKLDSKKCTACSNCPPCNTVGTGSRVSPEG